MMIKTVFSCAPQFACCKFAGAGHALHETEALHVHNKIRPDGLGERAWLPMSQR